MNEVSPMNEVSTMKGLGPVLTCGSTMGHGDDLAPVQRF